MTRAGNRLYFVGTSPSLGTELYVSDGSVAGTGPVADLFVGSGSGLTGTSLLVASGNTLYFTGTSSTEPGCRLFRAEGNLASCAYDPATTFLGPIMDAVVTASGAVVFTAVRTGPSDGEELRVLFNGQVINVPGTDLGPGTLGSAPSELVAQGENVYFRATDSQSGIELWQLTLPDLAAVFRDSFE
ncbi:MAG: hypothetical protein IPK97_15335 [Ahniella sp.]|nr:hypothetical protein [Ahniella sp.]